MRKISYKPFFTLVFLLLAILSLPQNVSESLRTRAVGIVSPAWRGIYFLKNSISDLIFALPRKLKEKAGHSQTGEIERLKKKIFSLESQVEKLSSFFQSDVWLESQLKKYQEFGLTENFSKLRRKEMLDQLKLQASSTNASVVFREPSTWGSSLWIDVGQKTNQALGKVVVAKNSPVLSGTVLVGVIENVEYARSRVRLISDAALVPSVRVVRGGEESRYLVQELDFLSAYLRLCKNINQRENALQLIRILKDQLSKSSVDQYLAKGELHGCSEPLWHLRGSSLKGVGFNYDYPDKEGPARSLRTGEVLNQLGKGGSLSLIREGDLLVTTGMDGLFPAGLYVAQVLHVYPLQEGASSYDIEAISLVSDLEDLKAVTVLPPLLSP